MPTSHPPSGAYDKPNQKRNDPVISGPPLHLRSRQRGPPGTFTYYPTPGICVFGRIRCFLMITLRVIKTTFPGLPGREIRTPPRWNRLGPASEGANFIRTSKASLLEV